MGNNERPFYRTGVGRVDTVHAPRIHARLVRGSRRMHCISTPACSPLPLRVPHRECDSGTPFPLRGINTMFNYFSRTIPTHGTARPSGAFFRTHGYAPRPVRRVGVKHKNSKRGLRSRGGPCSPHMSQAGVCAWSVRSRLAARSSRVRTHPVSRT